MRRQEKKRWERKHRPGDEENLAFPAVVVADEIQVVDGVPAVIGRQRRREVVVALPGRAGLLDDDLLPPVVDLEDHVPVDLPPFQLHERALAPLRHVDPRR